MDEAGHTSSLSSVSRSLQFCVVLFCALWNCFRWWRKGCSLESPCETIDYLCTCLWARVQGSFHSSPIWWGISGFSSSSWLGRLERETVRSTLLFIVQMSNFSLKKSLELLSPVTNSNARWFIFGRGIEIEPGCRCKFQDSLCFCFVVVGPTFAWETKCSRVQGLNLRLPATNFSNKIFRSDQTNLQGADIYSFFVTKFDSCKRRKVISSTKER